jgi:hypothetical protein
MKLDHFPTQHGAALDSPSHQGEGWVGMVFAVLVSTQPVEKAVLLAFGRPMPGDTPSNPIPTPALPLKGRAQNRRVSAMEN